MDKNISVIGMKFVGFIATLIALIMVATFSKDIPYGRELVGALTAVVISQVRDLYRKDTQNVKSDTNKTTP